MGARFVFQGYPNIHSTMDHYQGGKLLQVYDKNNNRFKSIESRYLATMQAQLAGQQSSISDQEYVEKLKKAQFKDLERDIEAQAMEAFNSVRGGDPAAFKAATGAIESALKSGKDVALALNDLIAIFKKYGFAVALIDGVNSNEEMTVDLSEILNVKGFLDFLAKEHKSDNITNNLNNWLSGYAELLNLIIGAKAQKVADEEVASWIKSGLGGMLGNRGVTVSYDFGKEGQKDAFTKAADIRYQGQYTNMTTTVSENGGALSLNVDNFASVKYYRGKDKDLAKMTSYSGTNSLVVSELHKLYGSGMEVDYTIYNTLAFSSYQTGNTNDENYRIIRSDMIAELAEKFLIGFSDERAQRLIIHNFTAYPTMAIVSSIANEASQKVKDGGMYGNNSDIFNIYIQKAVNANKWVGEEGVKSDVLKLQRVKSAKTAIDGLKAQGRLNFKNLNNYIKGHKYTAGGISLSGIIPKTKG